MTTYPNYFNILLFKRFVYSLFPIFGQMFLIIPLVEYIYVWTKPEQKKRLLCISRKESFSHWHNIMFMAQTRNKTLVLLQSERIFGINSYLLSFLGLLYLCPLGIFAPSLKHFTDLSIFYNIFKDISHFKCQCSLNILCSSSNMQYVPDGILLFFYFRVFS